MSAHIPHDIATRPRADAVELFHIAEIIAAPDVRSRDHRRLLEILESVGSICCGLAIAAVTEVAKTFSEAA